MIVVIDYGMGNLGSILNMLKRAGIEAVPSTTPQDLFRAERLILPGVGAFDAGIRRLRETGYLDVLNQRVLHDRIPILGICLGMQLFSRQSEEGSKAGLGWLDAETIRFRFPPESEQLKVPHMGWNHVCVRKPTTLLPSDQEQRFYFVHSYHVRCANPDDVLATTEYGTQFVSAVCRQNVLGAQFHPEKSHRFGLGFFRAFLSWTPGNGK